MNGFLAMGNSYWRGSSNLTGQIFSAPNVSLLAKNGPDFEHELTFDVRGANCQLRSGRRSLPPDRGWQVTGLARAQDEDFVRGLGAEFTTHAEARWDAVADAAVLQEQGLALVRDGGTFVGVQPSAKPAPERGITVDAVVAHPDGHRLGELLARTASGELSARVQRVVPLHQVADAHRAVAKGGVRGRYVLKP